MSGERQTLRPYQADAVEAILADFNRGLRSTLLVLATGLGKTTVFSEVASRFVKSFDRVLVLAHRNELLDQGSTRMAPYGIDTGLEQGESHVDVADLPHVTFANIATMKGARLARFRPNSFGLIIIDEAHRTAAAGYRKLLAHFPKANVLGVTATPERMDGKPLGDMFENVAYTMGIAEASQGGWLCPIELRDIAVDGLNLDALSISGGDFNAAEMEAQLLDHGAMLAGAAVFADLVGKRQTIVFTPGVASAHVLVEFMQNRGFAAAAVDGAMDKSDRKRVIDGYNAGEIQIVANCAVLTEGFDAPATSCVGILRATRSKGLLTQMIGRGLRPAPGKADCLVLSFAPKTVTARSASPCGAPI